jgi:hypothetical protein
MAVRRRPNPEAIAARSELECRQALEVLGGEELGGAPNLWLIREVLDNYTAALRNVWSQRRAPVAPEPILLVDADRVATAHGSGGRYWLVGDGESAVRSEPVKHLLTGDPDAEHLKWKPNPFGMDVPNAALHLWNATKRAPAETLRVIRVIEEATERLARTLPER